jgi:hypothetical protein
MGAIDGLLVAPLLGAPEAQLKMARVLTLYANLQMSHLFHNGVKDCHLNSTAIFWRL